MVNAPKWRWCDHLAIRHAPCVSCGTYRTGQDNSIRQDGGPGSPSAFECGERL